ncbi:MAG: ABC transporter permease [Bacteroidales bacterium]|nr:ABC transporter permease [Bacteroidales bacterium]
MGHNFFKIIFRFLYRNKTYSILNFLCLTFGLSCAVFGFLHIQTMLNHDKNQKNYDRLYSVEAFVTYFNGDRFPKEFLSASLADVLKGKIPEIENVSRVSDREHTFVQGDKSFSEEGIYADNNFFDLFTFPLLSGDKSRVLKDNNSIVISEDMAMKFFRTTDCLGKTIILKEDDKQESFIVSGVLEKVREKSCFSFDFIIPFSHFLAENKWAYEAGATSNSTWALINDKTNKDIVSNKIKNLIKDQEATLNQDLFLFPLKEKMLYFYSDGKRIWREMQNVVLAGIIAFAILLIACFNFINLSVAMNIKRYHEAGIKKVSGSGKGAIIIQYMCESLMITIISFIFAVILVYLLVPKFNTLFNADICMDFTKPGTIFFFLAISLFTGTASGILPALYLASSNPLNVLKGKISTSHSYSFLRQALIVFQFTIPIILIVFMLILNVQDRYLKNYDIGIQKDSVIVLDNSDKIISHSESIKNELLSIPGIEAVNFTNCIPTYNAKISNDITWEGKDDSEKMHFWCINTDFDYNKIVNIKMVAGRFFDRSFSADSVNYLINDVAARTMNNKNPVGSQITFEGNKGTVVGMFRDFHALDLAGPYVPTIIRIKPQETSKLLVKYSSGKYSSIIDKISSVYKQYDTESLFQPVLLRDIPVINSQSVISPGIIGLSSVIAITLACLGLFGLASFTAESRTKEIGIRKVNGATIFSVMKLLLTGYTKWITFAFVAAVPFAFVIGRSFLSKYYFHASMPLWVFIVGPLIAYVVALLTVSWQSLRAATKNPVEALRYE